MDAQIVPIGSLDLVPAGAGKDVRHRLGRFREWMATEGRRWHEPDLQAYRDHLLASYAPATAAAHLSTVRSRYREILRSNATRDALYSQAAHVEERPADRKAFVDEILARVENAIDPEASTVRTKTSQDRPDAGHLRLTSEQASALMAAPGLDTLEGLRDTAVIALMLCTGVREAELTALDVPDLRQQLGGELALHVQEGKGAKERLVPYGELDWVLAIVDRWLAAAGIDGGPVFRGLYKGGRRLRSGRLSTRAVQLILHRHPVAIAGEFVHVRPHDCRRTYSRRLYEAGLDLLSISQNLGHASTSTTLGYIGTLDVERRRAPAVYTFDLGRLAEIPVQGRLPSTASSP